MAVDQEDDSIGASPGPKLLQVIAEYKKREYFYLSYIASLESQLYRNSSTCKCSENSIEKRLDSEKQEYILDPAVQLEVKRLRHRLADTETLLGRTKEMLQAQMFSGQSVTGQRLITKCKALQEENNELGQSLVENELQPLIQTVAALKNHVVYLKNELRSLRELNSDMDRDNETLGAQVQEMVSTVNNLTREKEALLQEVQHLKSQLDKTQPYDSAEQKGSRERKSIEDRSRRRSTSSSRSNKNSKVSSRNERYEKGSSRERSFRRDNSIKSSYREPQMGRDRSYGTRY